MENIAILILCLIGLYLITQKWAWIVGFGFGGLIAAFYALANIFHFEILVAIGWWILAAMCWGITSAIVKMSSSN
jgi:hypothetical protein